MIPQEEVSIVFNFVCILSLANALERFCKDSQQNLVPLHSTAKTGSVGVGCCWMMLAVSQSGLSIILSLQSGILSYLFLWLLAFP